VVKRPYIKPRRKPMPKMKPEGISEEASQRELVRRRFETQVHTNINMP
jgi:hypothetical protein